MQTNIKSPKSKGFLQNVIDYFQSEQVHLYAAILGIALQPISPATGNVGFGIALGITLFRFPLLIQSWCKLFEQIWFRFLAAWLAWSFLSLFWSSDWAFGLLQFKATRVLLWIPILWPLLHRWELFISSILIGTTITQLIQALQIYCHWPLSNKFGEGSGFTTPTQTSLWDAIAVGIWLMLTVLASWKLRFATFPLTVLAASGLVWAGSRAAAFALVVELIGSYIVLALTSKEWIKRSLICVLVGVSILTGVYFLPHSQLSSKISRSADSVRISLTSETSIDTNIRVAMWKMAIEGWMKHPLFGVGIGGIPKTISKKLDAKESHLELGKKTFELSETTMIHSTYVQILTESGIVGFGLFASFMAAFFVMSLRSVRTEPRFIMTFGASLCWFVAAAFDGFQNSGGFLSVGAIVWTLSIHNKITPDMNENRITDTRLI